MQSFPLWEEEDGEEQGPAQAESRRKREREEAAPNERKKEGKNKSIQRKNSVIRLGLSRF